MPSLPCEALLTLMRERLTMPAVGDQALSDAVKIAFVLTLIDHYTNGPATEEDVQWALAEAEELGTVTVTTTEEETGLYLKNVNIG